MSGEPIGERPQKPIAPIRSDAAHREPFIRNTNDAASAEIGRDDAPLKTPEQVQSFLRQRQSDWDFEDNEARIESETERLNQLLRQEGVVTDENPELYGEVNSYVANGKIPTDEKFAASLADIVKRDAAGEWGESDTIGQPIPKKDPHS